MKNIPLFVLFCLSWSASAQDYDFERNIHTWPQKPPEKIAVEEQFRNNDLVILDENNEVSIAYNGDFFIRKYVRIKVLTAKGAEKIAEITLPETFDREADYARMPEERRQVEHRPILEDMKVERFASRIIGPGGKITECKLHYKAIRKRVFDPFDYSSVDPYVYRFYIDGVAVNDEVEIAYTYFVPARSYRSGSSGRYFFHGVYPKQNYSLQVKYYTKLYFFFNYNGAQPVDSTIDPLQIDANTYTWKMKNLFGQAGEKGARFHMDLPYVGYYRHAGDYGLYDMTNPEKPVLRKVLPYPWPFILRYWVSYEKQSTKYLHTHTDVTTTALNKLYGDHVPPSPDSTSVLRMNLIHSTIARSFDYKSSYARYKEDDYRETIGQAVQRKMVHEKDVYRLYREMLDRTGKIYYTIYAPDKRLESVIEEKAFPLLGNAVLFGLPHGRSVAYYYPKYNRYGFESSELPFYMEDTRVILIGNNIPKEDKTIPRYGFTFTPGSDQNINIRTSNVQVQVQLDSSKTMFDARLSLSGQFSTMIRGAYKYNFRDSTVNTKYYKKIYDLSSPVTLAKKEITSESGEFPYKTNLKLRYTALGPVRKSDNTFSLDIGNWFNHIIYDDFTATGRNLPFYADFRSQDRFKYRIKFDHPVQLLNGGDFETAVDNSLGKYTITVRQLSPDEIEIDSFLQVESDVVPAAKAADVEAIFSKAQKLNAGLLKFKVL